ncbi:MAG: carbonic anhydrase [Bauldia sp.]|nr:carbonic anhydrase [Bauldia sp.]
MDPLIEGYRRFRSRTWPGAHERYESLSREGQSPETLLISCSDSRVDPQTVFDAGPGEMFTIRNVAGLVPPYLPDASYHGTSAAIEYGVRVLNVARIVVLGHVQCGGIRAIVDGSPIPGPDFVEGWLKLAEDALKPLPTHLDHDHLLDYCETGVVKLSLANLRTFPWIADREDAGTLTLHGFRFGIRTGRLERLENGRFVAID